ncbi:transposase [Fibrobacter intestinalis]
MQSVHCITTIKTMAHTSWNCKYHIVFAPKFRRKVFYGERRLEIPSKYAVSSGAGFLKGKSSLQLYERFPELKFKYRNREFWCSGYYVDTAGKNAARIANYIKHQLDEDYLGNS